MRHRPPARLVAGLAVLVAVAACTLSPLRTPLPTASPTTSPTPSPTAEVTPRPAETPTPRPTPDPAAVPVFDAGDVVATTTDGLRLRRLPGVERQIVVERLPTGTELVVVMGPIHLDGFGWFLVERLDEERPARGWIAAGYDPDPFLIATGRVADPNPYLGGFAHAGSAEFGPITLEDEHHALRWIALDPAGSGCTLRIHLDRPDGASTQAVVSTVGIAPAPGELGSAFFAVQPELRGPVFVRVETDCAWALAVVRLAD